MKQYLDHLRAIQTKGTLKPPARANMPSSLSLFGYQCVYDLQQGFPLMTTKRIDFHKIKVELLWFLKGDTNIKFLIDNGFNQWNEDAYNYYVKIASANTDRSWNVIYRKNEDNTYSMFTLEEFVAIIKTRKDLQYLKKHFSANGYTLGDCGYQYGKVWRDWDAVTYNESKNIEYFDNTLTITKVDQIKKLLCQLRDKPKGRRHILTSIDPTHDEDLALYWCHCLAQFNCRPLTWEERIELLPEEINVDNYSTFAEVIDKEYNIPKYYLDCQMYQRSADMFLGVPFNIASYALLTHLFCKLLNMVPGNFIHSFGDSHIYENHMEQVKLQLTRVPGKLPTLKINTEWWDTEGDGGCGAGPLSIDRFLDCLQDDSFIKSLLENDIQLSDYESWGFIEGELSTGLKK